MSRNLTAGTSERSICELVCDFQKVLSSVQTKQLKVQMLSQILSNVSLSKKPKQLP